MKNKDGKRAMIEDTHIYIGQYEDEYYEAEEVFDAILACGKVDAVTCSSASSRMEDIGFAEVEKELLDAEKHAAPGLSFARLLHVKPDYITQGVNIANATYHAGYMGVTLYPFADNWDFENDRTHRAALRQVFELAGTNYDFIVIHPDESGRDSLMRFQKLFAVYTEAFVVLTGGPMGETGALMRRFSRVYRDTAFMEEDSLRGLCRAGFADRIFAGSGFPLTHYEAKHGPYGENLITLAGQYAEDAARMSAYLKIIGKYRS
jgi:hypothetical protein